MDEDDMLEDFFEALNSLAGNQIAVELPHQEQEPEPEGPAVIECVKVDYVLEKYAKLQKICRKRTAKYKKTLKYARQLNKTCREQERRLAALLREELPLKMELEKCKEELKKSEEMVKNCQNDSLLLTQLKNLTKELQKDLSNAKLEKANAEKVLQQQIKDLEKQISDYVNKRTLGKDHDTFNKVKWIKRIHILLIEFIESAICVENYYRKRYDQLKKQLPKGEFSSKDSKKKNIKLERLECILLCDRRASDYDSSDESNSSTAVQLVSLQEKKLNKMERKNYHPGYSILPVPHINEKITEIGVKTEVAKKEINDFNLSIMTPSPSTSNSCHLDGSGDCESEGLTSFSTGTKGSPAEKLRASKPKRQNLKRRSKTCSVSYKEAMKKLKEFITEWSEAVEKVSQHYQVKLQDLLNRLPEKQRKERECKARVKVHLIQKLLNKVDRSTSAIYMTQGSSSSRETSPERSPLLSKSQHQKKRTKSKGARSKSTSNNVVLESPLVEDMLSKNAKETDLGRQFIPDVITPPLSSPDSVSEVLVQHPMDSKTNCEAQTAMSGFLDEDPPDDIDLPMPSIFDGSDSDSDATVKNNGSLQSIVSEEENENNSRDCSLERQPMPSKLQCKDNVTGSKSVQTKLPDSSILEVPLVKEIISKSAEDTDLGKNFSVVITPPPSSCDSVNLFMFDDSESESFNQHSSVLKANCAVQNENKGFIDKSQNGAPDFMNIPSVYEISELDSEAAGKKDMLQPIISEKEKERAVNKNSLPDEDSSGEEPSFSGEYSQDASLAFSSNFDKNCERRKEEQESLEEKEVLEILASCMLPSDFELLTPIDADDESEVIAADSQVITEESNTQIANSSHSEDIERDHVTHQSSERLEPKPLYPAEDDVVSVISTSHDHEVDSSLSNKSSDKGVSKIEAKLQEFPQEETSGTFEMQTNEKTSDQLSDVSIAVMKTIPQESRTFTSNETSEEKEKVAFEVQEDLCTTSDEEEEHPNEVLENAVDFRTEAEESPVTEMELADLTSELCQDVRVEASDNNESTSAEMVVTEEEIPRDTQNSIPNGDENSVILSMVMCNETCSREYVDKIFHIPVVGAEEIIVEVSEQTELANQKFSAEMVITEDEIPRETQNSIPIGDENTVIPNMVMCNETYCRESVDKIFQAPVVEAEEIDEVSEQTELACQKSESCKIIIMEEYDDYEISSPGSLIIEEDATEDTLTVIPNDDETTSLPNETSQGVDSGITENYEENSNKLLASEDYVASSSDSLIIQEDDTEETIIFIPKDSVTSLSPNEVNQDSMSQDMVSTVIENKTNCSSLEKCGVAEKRVTNTSTIAFTPQRISNKSVMEDVRSSQFHRARTSNQVHQDDVNKKTSSPESPKTPPTQVARKRVSKKRTKQKSSSTKKKLLFGSDSEEEISTPKSILKRKSEYDGNEMPKKLATEVSDIGGSNEIGTDIPYFKPFAKKRTARVASDEILGCRKEIAVRFSEVITQRNQTGVQKKEEENIFSLMQKPPPSYIMTSALQRESNKKLVSNSHEPKSNAKKSKRSQKQKKKRAALKRKTAMVKEANKIHKNSLSKQQQAISDSEAEPTAELDICEASAEVGLKHRLPKNAALKMSHPVKVHDLRSRPNADSVPQDSDVSFILSRLPINTTNENDNHNSTTNIPKNKRLKVHCDLPEQKQIIRNEDQNILRKKSTGKFAAVPMSPSEQVHDLRSGQKDGSASKIKDANVFNSHSPYFYILNEVKEVDCSQGKNLSGEQQEVQRCLSELPGLLNTGEVLERVIRKLLSIEEPPGVTTLAKCIVERLSRDSGETPSYKETFLKVPMTPLQQQILAVMKTISEQKPSHYNSLVNSVLDHIIFRITLVSRSPKGETIQKLVQFFIGICRCIKDKTRVKNFCFDAFLRFPTRVHTIIFTILRNWPEVWPHKDPEKEQDVLELTMVYLIFGKDGGEFSLSLRDLMRNFYGYTHPDFTHMTMLQYLVKKLEDILDEKTTRKNVADLLCVPGRYSRKADKVIAAISIMARALDWKWTNETLLDKCLLPLLDFSKDSLNRATKMKIAAIKIIGLVGTCLPSSPKSSAPNKFMECLNRILFVEENVPPAVEEAAVVALLKIGLRLRHKVTPMLISWKPKFKPSVKLLDYMRNFAAMVFRENSDPFKCSRYFIEES